MGLIVAMYHNKAISLNMLGFVPKVLKRRPKGSDIQDRPHLAQKVGLCLVWRHTNMLCVDSHKLSLTYLVCHNAISSRPLIT